jgi:hypothetical protein
MVCAAKQVDVAEVVVDTKNLHLVLQTVDAIRHVRGYQIATTVFVSNSNKDVLHVLVELEKFHLPYEQFQREICAPIAYVVKAAEHD